MKRGFTIIELIVVVTVIGILAAISIASYATYKSQAADSTGESVASIVKAGVERYYTANNEYPLPSQLGAGAAGAVPSSYTTAAQLLNTSVTSFDKSSIKFTPCADDVSCSGTNLNKQRVYYLTKSTQTETIARNFVYGGCTYTLPASEVGAQSFLIAYWSNKYNTWNFARSDRGSPTTSDGFWCPFREL